MLRASSRPVFAVLFGSLAVNSDTVVFIAGSFFAGLLQSGKSLQVNRSCRNRTCAGVVRAGICSVCGTQRRDRQHDDRPPAHKHGYEKRWRRIRNAVLAAEPLCPHCCSRVGRVTAAVSVDHIVPLPEGDHDPQNLQPLCSRCHAIKTAKEQACKG